MNERAAGPTAAAEQQTPFWEIVEAGGSVLLAYHSCDGSERRRFSRHDRERRAFLCTECGAHYADSTRNERRATVEGSGAFPWGRSRG